MSILTEQLPDCIECGGEKIPIKTDFRIWLKFTNMMSGEMNAEKIADILKLVFIHKLPPTLEIAMQKLVEFYCGGDERHDNSSGTSKKRLYDFEYDANAIYTSFIKDYGIDILSCNMHWWKFRALFSALGEETEMAKIMKYRAVNLKEIKDKNQKKFYRKMKKLHALPDRRSQEERESEMAEALFSI